MSFIMSINLGKKIKFKGDNAEDLTYQPDSLKSSFYQICECINKQKMHDTRKVIFDENYNIIKVYEKEYNWKTLEKFMKNNKDNKYQRRSYRDISDVKFPNKGELIIAASDLVNRKNNNPYQDKSGVD